MQWVSVATYPNQPLLVIAILTVSGIAVLHRSQGGGFQTFTGEYLSNLVG